MVWRLCTLLYVGEKYSNQILRWTLWEKYTDRRTHESESWKIRKRGRVQESEGKKSKAKGKRRKAKEKEKQKEKEGKTKKKKGKEEPSTNCIASHCTALHCTHYTALGIIHTIPPHRSQETSKVHFIYFALWRRDLKVTLLTSDWLEKRKREKAPSFSNISKFHPFPTSL